MEEQPKLRRLDGPMRRVVRPGPVYAPARTAPPQPVASEPLISAAAEPAAPIALASEPAMEVSLKPSRWRLSWSRKRTIAAVATIILVVVAGVGIRAVMASQRIVTKNGGNGAPALNGDIDPTKLKGEGDGRINILLLGVGGGNHDGGDLSDTIMVASIDPINKTVAMLSVPRDLYVKIPGYGNGKINAANGQGGPELAKQVVGKILDLPIHYYVQVDFSGFKQAVNAVGGVDITNTDKLYDNQYPCDDDKHYCTFNLPPGQYHMNGSLALQYARCRHGSCGNDFGRAARQQTLLVALREKALQASTLTNPVKVSGLIDTVGDHVRTDFQVRELQKLAKLVKDIDIKKATNKVLDDTPGGLLVDDNGGRYADAGAVLLPAAGDFDYSQIQELAHSIFIDGYLKRENASVEVQNGTSRTGLAASVTELLKAYGYNVTNTLTAPEQTPRSIIIDYSGGRKPYTVKYLEKRFNTKAVVQPRPPGATEQHPAPDVAIIVGSDYHSVTASIQP